MPADVHLVDILENVLRDDRNETEASATATVDTPPSAPSADATDPSPPTVDDAHLNRTADATTTADGLEPDQPPAPATIDRPVIEINLTADEIQIPVFSEWTQKRREEEAEKEVDQEAIQLNTSAQRKNASATSRPPMLRLRTGKNYASPDCNAKIIAANSESQAIGHVLTASKDEYLLSPCDSRIWFIVELCEAMQAERIEMANFELFSSTPRNFSVGVSSRFPTRDWLNVGRFEAQDERFLQSFDLHPHLFGKYMRVDIHSHYAFEHFCPISIFRVYGTSEFEAFETENRPHPLDDLDEDDEDDEQTDVGKNKSNIFKSASEAVMSIVDKVKKAASFVKPADDRPKPRDTVFDMYSRMNACVTPNYVIHCENCTTELTNKVIALLQCKQRLLNRLVAVQVVRDSLHKSHMCAHLTGLDFNVNCNRSADNASSAYQLNDKQMEYIAHLFAPTYIMAMCNLLAAKVNRPVYNATVPSMPGTTAFNVSVDRKAAGTLLPSARNLSTELPKESSEQSDKIDVPGVAEEGGANLLPTMGTTEPAANAAASDAAKEKEAAGGERDERVDATISATSGEHPADESDKLEQNIFNIPAEVPGGDGKEPQPPTDASSGKIDIEPEPATPPSVIFVPEPITPHPPPAQQAPPTPTNDPVDAGDDQALSTPQNGAGQKQHGESVFLRLSNRVKVRAHLQFLLSHFLQFVPVSLQFFATFCNFCLFLHFLYFAAVFCNFLQLLQFFCTLSSLLLFFCTFFVFFVFCCSFFCILLHLFALFAFFAFLALFAFYGNLFPLFFN